MENKEKRKNWYRGYLKSEHWQRVRNRFYETTKYRCFICRVKLGLDLHHKRYELHGSSIIGYERKQDLRWLCRDCHFKIHKLRLEKEFASGHYKRTMYKKWFNKLKL